MTTTQKHPSPGEYWRSRSGEIRLIVCDARQHDSDFSGPYPIISMSKSGGITTHDASGSDYNDTDESPNDLLEHLSDCTGFDWKPPAPIDPGDGWELLPVGTVLQEGDEVYSEKNGWCKTCNVGIEVGNQIKGTDCIYRRRKPIAEWPKYIVNDDWSFTAYLIRDSETSYAAVHVDGTDEGAKIWDKHCSILIDQGTWRYVTESEALARVKPAEPVAAERIPDNRPARDVMVEAVKTLQKTGIWDPVKSREVIEQWLDDNPEDPPQFAKPFTDARSGIGIRKEQFVEDPICPNRPGDSGYDPHADELCQMCGEPAIPGTGGCRECTQYAIEATRCPVERTATPLVTAVVESPDDWVEITDTHPGHIRRECDEVCNTECEPVWIPVRSSVGMTQSDFSFTRIRCRRRDLPAPELTPFQQKMKAIGEREAEMKAPQPKRTPVRIGIQKNGVLFAVVNPKALDGNKEIKCPGGFYLEGE